MSRRIFSIVVVVSLCTLRQANAEVNCTDALVKDTYASNSGDYINWKMASKVTNNQWQQISRDAGLNVKIYGVPIGASYKEFQDKVSTYSRADEQELTASQFNNIAWTFLDPNGAEAYQACVNAQLNQSGIHIGVSSATADEVAIQVKYIAVGSQKNRIKPNWQRSGERSNRFPDYIDAGTNLIVLKRPIKELVFAVGYEGLGDSVTIGPINVPKYLPPKRRVATPLTKTSGPLPSGDCKNFSNWYTLCSEPQPGDWELVSHTFQLSGDRYCGFYANCEKTEENNKRVCYRFQMQGHNEDCSWRNDNTGIYNSTGVLQTTWSHDADSKPSP